MDVADALMRQPDTALEIRKLVFLSDLHFEASQHDNFDSFEELHQLLEELAQEHEPLELVLLGDILELLEVPCRGSLNKLERILADSRYRDLFEHFKAFSQHHPIRYIIGNHDREVIWNESIQKTLAESGITVAKPPEANRTWRFSSEGLSFTVYAEHGNQFDPPNRYVNFHEPLETPLGEHIVTDLIRPFKRLVGASEPWAADIDNVRPLATIPWWIFSRYFYHETNRALRFLSIPILMSFALTRILPIVLIWLHLGLRKLDTLFEVPRFLLLSAFVLLFFDLTIVMVALFLYLIKRDIQKTFKAYGFRHHKEVLKRRDHVIQTCVEEKLRDDAVDLVVFGHTHQRLLQGVASGGRPKGYANTGTWTKVMWRVNALLNFPPVFIPCYALTYVTVTQEGRTVKAELRERGKQVRPPALTFLERLVISGRKQPPTYAGHDRVLHTLTFPMHP